MNGVYLSDVKETFILFVPLPSTYYSPFVYLIGGVFFMFRNNNLRHLAPQILMVVVESFKEVRERSNIS